MQNPSFDLYCWDNGRPVRFMRSAIRYVTGRPLKDYWQGVQPNCCVHIIDISGGKATVKEMSKSFLL